MRVFGRFATILALVALLFPRVALAIDGATGEIDFTNATISIIMVDPTKGGTGTSNTPTDDTILIADGTDYLATAFPACAADGSQLLYDTATNTVSCQTLADADIPDTITIDHSTTGTLDLDQTTSPTVEGRAAWDATNDLFQVGDGAAGTRTFYPGGTMNPGQYCVYDSANSEIDCATSAPGSVDSISFMSTMGTLGTGSQTVYVVPGDVSATEGLVETPVSAATFTNLRCETDAVPGGSGITITGRSGTCGSLADSSLTCLVGAASTTCNDTANSMSPTVGQCVSFSIVGASTTTAVRLTCSFDRTA